MAKLELQKESFDTGIAVGSSHGVLTANAGASITCATGHLMSSTLYSGDPDGTEPKVQPGDISEEELEALASKWYRTALSSENSVRLAADVAEIAIRIAKREISSAWVCKECLKINLRRKTKCSQCGNQRSNGNEQGKDSSGAE